MCVSARVSLGTDVCGSACGQAIVGVKSEYACHPVSTFVSMCVYMSLACLHVYAWVHITTVSTHITLHITVC